MKPSERTGRRATAGDPKRPNGMHNVCIGDRVRMTKLAKAEGHFPRKACPTCGAVGLIPATGKVVGFSTDGLFIRIVLDGSKTPRVFHPLLWERIPMNMPQAEAERVR